MSLAQWIVLAVAGLRVAELALSRRNQIRLLARGGREFGSGHYPLLVVLHVAWLAAMFFTLPAAAPVHWPLIGIFLSLQGLRLWTIASLGERWTTRIITLPGAPLVRRGPYRWIRHPNYAVVVGEIAVLPLAFGSWGLALFFSVANAALLGWRIRIENRALTGRPDAEISH